MTGRPTAKPNFGSNRLFSLPKTMAFPSEKSPQLLESLNVEAMKSEQRGTATSNVEVTNISPHGFWILLGERELFVSFIEFPWFANASVAKIAHVEWPNQDHLYWPELDIDLSVRSIERPEEFPLKFGGS
jgi:hypothetical protein